MASLDHIPDWAEGKPIADEARRLLENADESERRRIHRLLQDRTIWEEFTLERPRGATKNRNWPETPEGRDRAIAMIFIVAFEVGAAPMLFTKQAIRKHQRELRNAAGHLEQARRLRRVRLHAPPIPLTTEDWETLRRITASLRQAANEAENIPFAPRARVRVWGSKAEPMWKQQRRREYLISLQDAVLKAFGNHCRGTVAKIASAALDQAVTRNNVRNSYATRVRIKRIGVEEKKRPTLRVIEAGPPSD